MAARKLRWQVRRGSRVLSQHRTHKAANRSAKHHAQRKPVTLYRKGIFKWVKDRKVESAR